MPQRNKLQQADMDFRLLLKENPLYTRAEKSYEDPATKETRILSVELVSLGRGVEKESGREKPRFAYRVLLRIPGKTADRRFFLGAGKDYWAGPELDLELEKDRVAAGALRKVMGQREWDVARLEEQAEEMACELEAADPLVCSVEVEFPDEPELSYTQKILVRDAAEKYPAFASVARYIQDGPENVDAVSLRLTDYSPCQVILQYPPHSH